LVVIAIIAILAASLFPVFAEARRKVLKYECQGSMRFILCSIRLYAADYDGRLPSDFDRMTWTNDDLFWNREEYSCPVWTEVNGRGRGYGFNRLITKMTMKQLISDTAPFIWDGTDIVAIPDTKTLGNSFAYGRHSPRGERRVNIGFLDGRVEWKEAEAISTKLFLP